MSYHNGSVWPHDNSLIALGFLESKEKEVACRILDGFLSASVFLELHRLPELFCGFPRLPANGPTLYPVACSPQAWAAGAVFLILQACLGLSVRASESRIYLFRPALPESIERVRIRNLKVGNDDVDLALVRRARTVSVEILRRTGDIEIVSIK